MSEQEIMLRLSAIRHEYCTLVVLSKKSKSTQEMPDDVYFGAIAGIRDSLRDALDWLLAIDDTPLSCKCWEIPLGSWAEVVWAVQQSAELFVDRSEFRDRLIFPLRKETAKFMSFYVASEQKITTDPIFDEGDD
ncbi:MAG: hypothetical protein ACRC62_38895 [Microcoleus sp.]